MILRTAIDLGRRAMHGTQLATDAIRMNSRRLMVGVATTFNSIDCFRVPFAAAIAILASTLIGPIARADDWATPGLDLAHTRSSAERSGALFGDGSWTAADPGFTLATPVVADGFMVKASNDGVVSARRADTGELLWQVSLGSNVQGTPAVARGRVFVPTLGSTLFALQLTDGATLWARDMGGMTLASPAPIDGDIVVAPGYPRLDLVRLSGETGETVWQSPAVMIQFSNTAPAISGGLVVVGSQQGRYYAFDATTGAFRWEYVADGTVNLTAPIILDGRVYMAGGDQSNHVHAVDAATGQAVSGWPITLPTPAPDIAGTRQGGWRAVSSFAAAGGLLLLQTRLDDALGSSPAGPFTWLSRESVLALDPSSGAVVWEQPFARAETTNVNNVPKFFVCPSPAAYGDELGAPLIAVASSLDAVAAVLDVATGSERARYTVAGRALASPVLANARLYSIAVNGTTDALGSSVNHAPAAPVLATYPHPIPISNATVSWLAASDPDGETASYELRIDADGEILSSWQQKTFLDAGVTSAALDHQIVAGRTYTFAVRARDPHGAMSPWSAPGTLTVVGRRDPPSNPPRMVLGAAALISITDPRPAQGQTDEAMPQALDGAGCSIGGGARHGWTAVLALFAFCALIAHARRDRRSTTR